MRPLLIASVLALAPVASQATILTFDVAGGVTNFQNMPGTYGDNVSALVDGLGHSYDVGAEGFTSNVSISYGTPGEDPALWTTGYGDLTNVMFNDADGDTTFTTTFTAETGYLVDFYSFDIAWFFGSDTTVQGFKVIDVGSNQVLHSESAFTLFGGETHQTFSFATPLQAAQLALVVDLTGLGGISDDVGLDNIRFGQSAVVAPGIPEPSTWAMMLLGFLGAGAALRTTRRKALA